MDDADFNVGRSTRLLKPGEVRLAGRPAGFAPNNQVPFDRPLYRAPRQPTSDRFYQKPPQVANHYDFQQPICFINPPEQQQQAAQPQIAPGNNFSSFELWRQGSSHRSESDISFNRIFSRAPGACLARSDSNQSLLDALSSPSSPDSPCQSFRTAADRQPRPSNSVSTQTERSPFEEKFLFRESILLGCDLVAELALKVPAVAEIKECADYIREKTIQSRSQNICSGLAAGATEHKIISEYVKTFIKMADSWLEARNCFGLTERCYSRTCSLDIRDLPTNYIDWMHSSRQLLNGIVSGLEKVNLMYGSDNNNAMITPYIPDPGELALRTTHPSPGGGLWGYPPNPPCHCAPIPSRSNPMDMPPPNLRPPNYTSPTEPPGWFNNQPITHYSGFNNTENSEINSEYLKPSSYDVPRKNMTPTEKRSNISKAKSDAFQDTNIQKGYIVNLSNSGSKHDVDSQDADDHKIRLEVASKGKQNSPTYKQKREEDLKKMEDSDSGSEEVESLPLSPAWKSGKSLRQKHLLSQTQMSHMQAIAEAICKFDLPQPSKYSPKVTEAAEVHKTKYTLSPEAIMNKVKNNVYESIEQFIHDCRKLFKTLSFQKNKQDKENVIKLRGDFETLLENLLESTDNLKHISGDLTEFNFYPELRYTRKKNKLGKVNQTNCDNTDK